MSRKLTLILMTLIGTVSLCVLCYSNTPAQTAKAQQINAAQTITRLKKEAENYLAEAENCEIRKDYASAEVYYRNFAEKMKKVRPEQNYDGILGRIAELTGKHSEASSYYHSYEVYQTKKRIEELAKNTADTSTGPTTVVATGRLLRVLQTIPRQKALDEFDFGGEVLSEENSLASRIGMQICIIGPRLIIKDYRTGPSKPISGTATTRLDVATKLKKTETKSTSTIGPQGDATTVQGVNTAGTVLTGETLRRLLAGIDRETACREFEFGRDFHPDYATRYCYENYSDCPLAGYSENWTVRKLVTKQVVILNPKVYDKLVRLSKTSRHMVARRTTSATSDSTWKQRDYCYLEATIVGEQSAI